MKLFKTNLILFKCLGFDIHNKDTIYLKAYRAILTFFIVNMTFPEILFFIYTDDIKELTSCLTTLTLMVVTTFKIIVCKAFFARLLDFIENLQKNFNKSENFLFPSEFYF